MSSNDVGVGRGARCGSDKCASTKVAIQEYSVLEIEHGRSRECGLLPLPAGERGEVRELRSRGWFPLTAFSPMGRGSPAVLRLNSVLTNDACVEKIGTLYRIA